MEFKYLLGIEFKNANTQRASICCAGLYLQKLHGECVLQDYILLNPSSRFNFLHSDMHGIKEPDVRNAPYFPALADRLGEILKAYPETLVVFHNASFNVSNYCASLKKYNYKTVPFHYISTSKVGRMVLKRKENYTLRFLCQYFQLPNYSRYYALDEAKMTIMLFEKMMDITGCPTIDNIVNYSNLALGYVKEDGSYTACVRRLDQIKIDESDLPSPKTTTSEVYGKKFSISKNYRILPRKRAIVELASLGGIVSSSLTKDCDYYVYDVSPEEPKTSKLLKIDHWNAAGSNIKIISELEFLKMIGLL